MGVRARWHFDEAVFDAADPFASVDTVTAQGTLIELSTVAALNQRLVRLLERESALAARHITCSIKDHPETTCLGCPISGQGDRGPLCHIGVDQARIMTELVVLQDADCDPQP